MLHKTKGIMDETQIPERGREGVARLGVGTGNHCENKVEELRSEKEVGADASLEEDHRF